MAGKSFLDEVSERISWSENGILSAKDERGSGWVRSRQGQWRAFESSSSLSVLMREDEPNGPSGAAMPVSLAGDLAFMSAPDLLGFLSQGGLSGVLHTRAEGVDRTLSFKAGRVTWGASSDPAERLGELCLRNGLLDATARELLVDLDDEPLGRRLGQRLVEAGVMNGHDLWRALRLQVSEVFWALLIKNRGAFAFVHAPAHPTLETHLSLDVQMLLLEGARRIDEMHHFRRRIGSGAAVPVRAGEALDEDANAAETRVWELIDGESSLAELGVRTRLGEFETTKAVHGLLERGLATLATEFQREKTPGPKTIDVKLMLAGFNKLLADVLRATQESGLDGPYRISVDAYLQSESQSRPLLSGLELEPNGMLSEALLIDRLGTLESSAAPALLLRDELDQVLSFALFQAREILEPSQHDALSRRAQALLSA